MSDLGNKEIMAQNISANMKKLGVDRNKLSADLGISYTTISDWINAKTYPRIDKIEELANYFKVSKSALVENQNSIPLPKNNKLFIEMKKRAKLDVIELAKLLGCSVSTVEDWLSGKNTIPFQTLVDLAEKTNQNISSGVSDRGGLKSIIYHEVSDYNYFDTAISAGIPDTVEAFTKDSIEQIQLPDLTLGKYAGNSDVFITRINGDSMNNVIPDKSLIAVKQIESAFDLENGDIVVFRNGSGMSVKRFYNDTKEQRLVFRPDSNDNSFVDMVINYDELEDLQIYGKVVVYIVYL